jgi:hypothetical protein
VKLPGQPLDPKRNPHRFDPDWYDVRQRFPGAQVTRYGILGTFNSIVTPGAVIVSLSGKDSRVAFYVAQPSELGALAADIHKRTNDAAGLFAIASELRRTARARLPWWQFWKWVR